MSPAAATASRESSNVELLERQGETGAIEAAIGAAITGSGRLVLVEGQAGVGKTELLRLGRQRARSAGMYELHARGGPREAEFPFGVTRQLFEPLVRRVSPAERPGLFAGAAAGAAPVVGVEAPLADPTRLDLLRAMHGLYWLCSNLAERAPIVLVVDDAHAADRESLRWLSYMSIRLEDLPLLLLVAARPGEQSEHAVGLAELASVPAATVLLPAPLSERASARVVQDLRGKQAADEFCRACHAATGGNPFYLRELVLETQRRQIAPVAGQVGQVSRLSPRAIASATLVRLAQLPAPSVVLAQAVAILGLQVELRQAAALADVETAAAERAADALAAAAIFEPGRPLNFTHPVVASAVYSDMPAGARSQQHARAAELLAQQGAEADAIASHLLRVEPDADPTVVERLARAAAEAMRRGAPETSVVYLRRAAREQTETAARSELLYRLGRAELVAGEAGSIEHLEEALGLAADPRLMTQVAVALCNALAFVGRFAEADSIARATIKRLGASPDASLVLRLEAVRWQTVAADARLAAAARARLPALLEEAASDRSGDRTIFMAGALMLATGCEGHAEVAPLVRRGLDRGRFVAEETADSLAAGQAVCALAFLDQLDAANELLDALFADARTRGSVFAYVAALIWRGWIDLRQGRIASAEADEREAVRLAQQHGLQFALPWAEAFLASTLLERGQVSAAGDVIDALAADQLPLASLAGMALDVRGRVRLAQGRREEGIADLQTAGERQESIRTRNPNVLHWRSSLALALGRDSSEATRLVDTELARARDVALPRALGVALRARGLLRGGEQGIADLHEAVATLEGSPAALEYARALVSLGSLLRRQSQRAAAREPLRRALDLADRVGATPLADEARAELAASGARPRRRRLTGTHSLTPTERRVAEIAAAGASNKEIAQALFVSRKTVEMHLGNAYRKLGIHSRKELTDALGALEDPEA